jgi:hypothetical protein
MIAINHIICGKITTKVKGSWNTTKKWIKLKKLIMGGVKGAGAFSEGGTDALLLTKLFISKK